MATKWTHVAHQMLTDIAEGSPGLIGPVASGRTLAGRYGVSAPVMGRVLRFLEDAGALYPGLKGGYWVGPEQRETAAAEVAGWQYSEALGYWTRPMKDADPGSQYFREVLGRPGRY